MGVEDGSRLVAAAREAHARRDYRTAYRSLSRARSAQDLANAELVLLADAAWWLGKIGECLRTTEELHRKYVRAGEVDRAAMQALELGFNCFLRGEHLLGSGWVNRARRLMADLPFGEPHCVLAYLDVSQAIEEHRLDEASAGAKDLQRRGEELGSPTFTALGLLCQGLVEIRRGHLRTGFALVDEAMLPVVAQEVEPAWAGNIYCTMISVCHDLADLERAREWTRVTRAWCDRFSDAVMFLGICRAHRVQLLTVEAAWEDIEREVRAVRADLADMNVDAVAEAEYQLGESWRLRGDSGRAAEGFAAARRLGREPQPGEALLLLATGDGTRAWAAITSAVADAGPDPFRCPRLLRAQVQIALATGRVAAADSAARRLEEVRGHYPTPGFEAWADHATGAVLLARGEAGRAVPLLTRAAQLHQGLGAAHDAALAELDLAAALRLLGRREIAAGHEAPAREVLRRLGVRQPAPSRTAAPGGLTRRELEVLRLVARGDPNRMVAAELGVSEATVRRHLANVYSKLGVGSRTAAAAWVHEHAADPGILS